jgi:signal transduction histidine kinase
MEALKRLRIQLTAWYIGVFAIVLLAFGAALFSVLNHQISSRMDQSLQKTADQMMRAFVAGDQQRNEGLEQADALADLRISGRTLYLFDAQGALVHPDTAGVWIRSLATEAREHGRLVREHEFPNEVSWRALARPFTLPGDRAYVAVVSARVVELDDEYAGLLLAFILAALAALAAVGFGGWLVARRSTEPIRDSLQRMREFMADAAHELRTPVAVVEGHSEVALRRPRTTAEYAEVLTSIHAEATRLGGILENLLTIARADAQAWPVHLESLFLDDLLVDVTANAQVVAEAKRVTVDLVALDELPVRGDPDLLRQLVMILLDNAVKFSPDGAQVVVAARRQNREAQFTVEDHGPGIDPEILPHVFDRFYRGDRARSRATGAGLGLSIANWIAEVHGATITIDTQPAKGTRLTVTFPLEEIS